VRGRSSGAGGSQHKKLDASGGGEAQKQETKCKGVSFQFVITQLARVYW